MESVSSKDNFIKTTTLVVPYDPNRASLSLNFQLYVPEGVRAENQSLFYVHQEDYEEVKREIQISLGYQNSIIVQLQETDLASKGKDLV